MKTALHNLSSLRFSIICLFGFPLLAIAQPTQINLPINWSTPGVNYTVVDFDGNQSSLDVDPTDASNTVLKVIKTGAAGGSSGTTLGTEAGFATSIPFASGATSIRARVFAPSVNMQIRMKAEVANDPTRSVETPRSTTTANGWQILTFDFANQAPGTSPINFSFNYNKLTVFFNFGIDGATTGPLTFYIDDIEFGSGPGTTKLKIDLPITWDDSANVDYSTTDFGGNLSELAADPLNPSNIVLKLTRTEAAIIFAGTVLSNEFGLRNAIPLTAANRFMTAKVYSPVAGIAVRLKVENINGGVNAETDQFVSVVNQWEYLTFDFAQHAAGTPAINYNNVHNKLVIFFNFGALGSVIGERIFYLDDVLFGTLTDLDLPVLKSQLTVYPNPNTGRFQVEGLNGKASQVKMFNQQGKLVHQQMNNALDNVMVDTKDLPAGLYKLRIESEGEVQTKTVIVN